jgi:hypothetical protein
LTFGSPYNVDHPFSKDRPEVVCQDEKEPDAGKSLNPFWGCAISAGGGGAIDEIQKAWPSAVRYHRDKP